MCERLPSVGTSRTGTSLPCDVTSFRVKREVTRPGSRVGATGGGDPGWGQRGRGSRVGATGSEDPGWGREGGAATVNNFTCQERNFCVPAARNFEGVDFTFSDVRETMSELQPQMPLPLSLT